MKGAGFLLLWNDIEPAVEPEYNLWHSGEHVPQRVNVPGILAGRRYARTGDGTQRYLTIYELESTAVLSSAPYLALMEGPTPWSRRMCNHFRNITRVACHRLASAGAGMGAFLLMIRMDGSARDEAAADESTDKDSTIANDLAACATTEGIVAVHWCRTDPQVPRLAWQATTAPPARHDRILIAEATDLAALRAARPKLEALARHAAVGFGNLSETLCGPEYALLHAVHA